MKMNFPCIKMRTLPKNVHGRELQAWHCVHLNFPRKNREKIIPGAKFIFMHENKIFIHENVIYMHENMISIPRLFHACKLKVHCDKYVNTGDESHRPRINSSHIS